MILLYTIYGSNFIFATLRFKQQCIIIHRDQPTNQPITYFSIAFNLVPDTQTKFESQTNYKF